MSNLLDPNFPKPSEAFKANLVKGFTNPDEHLLGADYKEFKDCIRKGEVGVVTPDDITKSYGGRYFTKARKEEFGNKLDEMVKKGETENLSQEEFEFLEKACEDYRALERKAVPIKKSEGGEILAYQEVYVLPVAETTD